MTCPPALLTMPAQEEGGWRVGCLQNCTRRALAVPLSCASARVPSCWRIGRCIARKGGLRAMYLAGTW